MATKQRPIKWRLQLHTVNQIGTVLSVLGFLLILLCLIGTMTSPSRSIYFARITSPNDSSIDLRYGWHSYCDGTSCQETSQFMVMPFDVEVATVLNTSYPLLVANPNTVDVSLYPAANPMPAHNPHIYEAAVMSLVIGGGAMLIGFLHCLWPHKFTDDYYSRGFLAWSAAVLSLLLVAQSSVMYGIGIEQLNLTYPNLNAESGVGVILAGVGFTCFAISGLSFFKGCLGLSSSDEDNYQLIE